MRKHTDSLQDQQGSLSQHETTHATYTYVGAFVDELQRTGLRHVIICPGSRSTPLAITFAAQPEIHVWMHVDERSAAFFALGMAKRLQQAVAVLCTSGTAAANFLPAVIEAKLSCIPLLIITADRPHELRDCGAPQAIDQIHLFGLYAKWFVDVALPEATDAMLRYIRTIADRATALAQAIPAGPIHLNFPLREPLMPDPTNSLPLPSQRTLRPASDRYIVVHDAAQSIPTPDAVAHFARQLHMRPAGLIIVGPQNDSALATALLPLARYLKYPILADPLSQMRVNTDNLIVQSYDAFLRAEHFVNNMKPQCILRFGSPPTSKPVLQYLQHTPSCPHWIIDGTNRWEEPTQLATEIIHTHPPTFCQQLLVALQKEAEEQDQPLERSNTWLQAWQVCDRTTRQVLYETLQAFPQLFEGRIFTELAELLPNGTTLFAGNSMPIRDMDTFFWGNGKELRLMGNRGANGIDGVISSALGVSAVAPSDEPTVLVIGDLSFFHDLNGLLAARLHRLNLLILLINNDGGGIFSFLPQASFPTYFEPLFGVPTGLNFSHAGALYDAHFQRVESWEQFRSGVTQGLHSGGLQIIEVRTERASNVQMHRQLWHAVTTALQESHYQTELPLLVPYPDIQARFPLD